MNRVPIFAFDEAQADDAFAAHAALVKAERDNPRLADNEHWQALRDTAFARFLAAFRRA